MINEGKLEILAAKIRERLNANPNLGSVWRDIDVRIHSVLPGMSSYQELAIWGIHQNGKEYLLRGQGIGLEEIDTLEDVDEKRITDALLRAAHKIDLAQ